jgi:integrase/recombinase XerD
MSSTPVLYAEPVEAALPAVVQPDTNARMVDLWVSRHESPNTRRNYRRQARLFLTFVRRPLATVGIGDLQAYLASIEPLASVTRANATAALKSLLAFAHETGYIASAAR